MSRPTTTSMRARSAAVDDDPGRGSLVAALDEQADFPAIQRLRSSGSFFWAITMFLVAATRH